MPTPNTTSSIGDINLISLLQESGLTAQQVADSILKAKDSILNGVTKVGTIALLRQLTTPLPTVWVSGYHTVGDGAFGSNLFEWDATAIEDDNGGTIIKCTSIATGRYRLKFSGAVNVKWFGAIPYSDYTIAINSFDCFKKVFDNYNNIIIDDTYMLWDNLLLGLNVKDNTVITGGGVVDYSKQLNDSGWEVGIFNIRNNYNITIKNITFDGGSNRPEAIIYKGEASAITIDKRTSSLGTSNNIRIEHCKFINTPYSGFVADVGMIQKQYNWYISNNYFEINNINPGVITTGSQHAWDIISVYSFDTTSLKSCIIENNTIYYSNHLNGGGTFYKCSGLENSIVQNNLVINELQGVATSTSGPIEIRMKNSTFNNNNILGDNIVRQSVFSGCINIKITNCYLVSGIIIAGAKWRKDNPTLSVDVDIINCRLNNISYITSVGIEGIKYGTIDIKFIKCEINGLIRYSDNINTYFNGCEFNTVKTELSMYPVLYNECVFFNTNNGSSGIELNSGSYTKCIFHAGINQTGNYIVNPKGDSLLLNCSYTITTNSGENNTLVIGGASPSGNCEIYSKLTDFFLRDYRYVIYDPSDFCKTNLRTTIPTNKSYKKYDRVINFNAVNVNDTLEWICTSSGTPGTWISASKILA